MTLAALKTIPVPTSENSQGCELEPLEAGLAYLPTFRDYCVSNVLHRLFLRYCGEEGSWSDDCSETVLGGK